MADLVKNNDVSSHDREVLKQIFSTGLPCDCFDEEASGVGGNLWKVVWCYEINTTLLGYTLKKFLEAVNGDNEQVRKAKELEIEGIKAAEIGNIEAAVNLFGQAINTAPEWPSTYNNRAQALRLIGDTEGAKSDLDKALELSHESGYAACQAFTQRGLIRKREGNDEGATQDFKKAANLGSGFAKQVLAAMNPYAALCNQMLCDVMHKLKSDQPEPEL